MSTVEALVAESDPKLAEKHYKSMIRAVAARRRHEIDPGIVEASGRFAVDSERDQAIARRRVEAVQRIEEAKQRLVELRANPPTPAPTRETPLSEFETIGQVALVVAFLNGRNTLWGPKVDHDHAVREAEGEIKKAQSYLRSTSALEIDEQIRAARATIERTRQAEAERAELQERLANLKSLLDRANPRSEEDRAEVLARRAEYAEFRKRFDGLPDVDHEAAARAGDEIEKLAEAQLDPSQMEFSQPSGSRQELFAVPVRFA